MFWGLVQRSQSPNVSTISFPHSLHKRQGSSSQVASLDSFPWEMGNPISRWRFGHFSRHLIEKGTWVQRKVWGHWLLLGDESREEISHIITFFKKCMYRFLSLLIWRAVLWSRIETTKYLLTPYLWEALNLAQVDRKENKKWLVWESLAFSGSKVKHRDWEFSWNLWSVVCLEGYGPGAAYCHMHEYMHMDMLAWHREGPWKYGCTTGQRTSPHEIRPCSWD